MVNVTNTQVVYSRLMLPIRTLCIRGSRYQYASFVFEVNVTNTQVVYLRLMLPIHRLCIRG